MTLRQHRAVHVSVKSVLAEFCVLCCSIFLWQVCIYFLLASVGSILLIVIFSCLLLCSLNIHYRKKEIKATGLTQLPKEDTVDLRTKQIVFSRFKCLLLVFALIRTVLFKGVAHIAPRYWVLF